MLLRLQRKLNIIAVVTCFHKLLVKYIDTNVSIIFVFKKTYYLEDNLQHTQAQAAKANSNQERNYLKNYLDILIDSFCCLYENNLNDPKKSKLINCIKILGEQKYVKLFSNRHFVFTVLLFVFVFLPSVFLIFIKSCSTCMCIRLHVVYRQVYSLKNDFK